MVGSIGQWVPQAIVNTRDGPWGVRQVTSKRNVGLPAVSRPSDLLMTGVIRAVQWRGVELEAVVLARAPQVVIQARERVLDGRAVGRHDDGVAEVKEAPPGFPRGA